LPAGRQREEGGVRAESTVVDVEGMRHRKKAETIERENDMRGLG